MIPKNFKPEWIRELNDIGTQLQDVTVRIPSDVEQQEAKAIIEEILPPDQGSVNMPYVRNVLIAYKYAEEHFGGAMLKDIEAGKKCRVSDYQKP